MNEAIDILTFLGIPGDKIQHYQVIDNEEIMTIFVELKDIRPYCPVCGHTDIKIKGYYETTIRHSVIAHKKVRVTIRNRRYLCSKCGKTFKQGLIYRTAQFNYNKKDESAIPSAPSAKGKATLLKELKIKSEVDVRQRDNKGKDETAGVRSSPLGSSVKYQYLPMKFGGSNIFEEDDNDASIKSFFEYMAVESNYPIAFHCVRGTDRTGALAYAIGALCGVSYYYLLRDYLFSNFANIGGTVKESTLESPSYYAEGINNSEGSSMSEKAANYLKAKVGVGQETLESIKAILLK